MNPHDQSTPATDDAIEAAAADWLAQREAGFTPEQETEFLRWRLADPRHGAALQLLEETCSILEQMPLLQGDARLETSAAGRVLTGSENGGGVPSPREVSAAKSENRGVGAPRLQGNGIRRYVLVAASVAAALVLGVFLWHGLTPPTTVAQNYATAPRGYQRVLLPDNSVAQLNGGTQLKVDFSPDERRVNLAVGEANFHVAKDANRPFVVTALGVSVRAVGTAFNVRVNGSSVDVLVTEGVVQVERQGGVPLAPLALAAGERAVIGSAPAGVAETVPVERLDPARIQVALAWQEPSLVFVEASLAEVIARFNEHNRVQLELGDPDLGARLVGGTFRQDDVDTFVRLLEGGGDIVAERTADGRIVLRRAR